MRISGFRACKLFRIELKAMSEREDLGLSGFSGLGF